MNIAISLGVLAVAAVALVYVVLGPIAVKYMPRPGPKTKRRAADVARRAEQAASKVADGGAVFELVVLALIALSFIAALFSKH